jgi:hypothetical protein
MTQGYSKIFRRIWRDEKFRALAPNEKLAAFYLLSGQSNRIGYFAFSMALAAEELGLPLDECRARISSSGAALGWALDEPSGVVLIPTWWKWNPPPNPDALKGALTDLQDVPRSSLLPQFIRASEHLRPEYRPVFAKAIRPLEAHPVGHGVRHRVVHRADIQTEPSFNQTEPNQSTKPVETPTVAHLVDKLRAINGIKPSRRDGQVVAGLVKQFGAALVWQVIGDDAPSLVAADSPLLLLASRCKRAAAAMIKDRPRRRPTVDEWEARQKGAGDAH